MKSFGSRRDGRAALIGVPCGAAIGVAVALIFLIGGGGKPALQAPATRPIKTPPRTDQSGAIHYGCNASRKPGKTIVTVTESSGTTIVCADKKTMYASLLAIHASPKVIDQQLTAIAVTSGPLSEYDYLRELGAPKKLARRLAKQVAREGR